MIFVRNMFFYLIMRKKVCFDVIHTDTFNLSHGSNQRNE
jgi:hypothetical protein